MIEQMVAKVTARIETDDKGCWLWQGAKNRKGYGVVGCHERRTTFYAHRIMYESAKGQIPKGLQIDHLCRNPACCNPDHLEAVTPAENTRRGNSPAAARARRGQKSSCPRGHAFTEANTYFDGRGYRSCRECRRIRHEDWASLRRTRKQVYRNLTAMGGNVVAMRPSKNGGK